MFRYKATFFFIIIPTILFSQALKGKVYDSTSTVKNIKVNNITKKTVTYTDDKGNFKIRATINDSIVFSSLFYEDYILIVSNKNFEDIVVIELKKIVNELEGVLLSNSKTRKFSSNKYKASLNSQLSEDIKRDPYSYGLTLSGSKVMRGNIVEVIGLIGSLFKRKNKKTPVVFQTIDPEDLFLLFSEENLFDDSLLESDLKIPKNYQFLFFEYCSAQNIDKAYMVEQKNLELLDILLEHSNAFNKLIRQAETKFKD